MGRPPVAGTNDPKRRGVFDVDEDRAIGALRMTWGDAYDIGYEHPRWVASSRDRERRVVAAETPDGLNLAIRADWAARGGQ
jgi:hypothetical protein